MSVKQYDPRRAFAATELTQRAIGASIEVHRNAGQIMESQALTYLAYLNGFIGSE